jgi:hypothetical protein
VIISIPDYTMLKREKLTTKANKANKDGGYRCDNWLVLQAGLKLG